IGLTSSSASSGMGLDHCRRDHSSSTAPFDDHLNNRIARMIMPFKRPAMSIEEYQALSMMQWSGRLQNKGYGPDTSGLDKASRSGVQSFCVLCTNRAYAYRL